MTLSRSQHLKAAAIAALGTPVLEALGGTYRFRVSGAEHLAEVAREGRQPIIAFWHGRILAGMLYFRDRGIVAMASENFDGEWIARLMRGFGYPAARGSTSRGGGRALVQLRRDMAAGRPAALTLDGPRGPARVAQPGAVWLASATQNPIVPFHVEAASYWTVNSWDRHQVPKPGSDIALAIGAPLDVPSKADEDVIEQYRARLEHTLADLEARALDMLTHHS